MDPLVHLSHLSAERFRQVTEGDEIMIFITALTTALVLFFAAGGNDIFDRK